MPGTGPHDRVDAELVYESDRIRSVTEPAAGHSTAFGPYTVTDLSQLVVRDAARSVGRRTRRLYGSLLKDGQLLKQSLRRRREPSEALALRSEQAAIAAGIDLSALEMNLDWQTQATLLDGTTVTLRALHPEDRDVLLEGFSKLSHESRYQRFMASMDQLPEDYLTYLLNIDFINHVAFGATIQDPARMGERGIGIARFVRLPEQPDEAELAVTILDEAQGTGLGSLLMMCLGMAARERNITALRAEVLPTNTGMRRLAERFGGECVCQDDGMHTWRIALR